MKPVFSSSILVVLLLTLLPITNGINQPAAPANPADADLTYQYIPFLPNNLALPGEMVLIPAGEFQMGCHPEHNGGFACPEDEIRLHTVYLDAYRIDKYEVTNAQYATCMAASGSGCTQPYSYESLTRNAYFDNPTFAGYPVIYVNWFQASAYCAWANKRLPTEAEWEKAARGASDTRAYPWGDQNPTCSLANSFNNTNSSHCVGDTVAIGSYPAGASPYGVMDMAGNVFDWVNDWYHYGYYYISPFSNPQGPLTGTYKVLRGGSFGNRWEIIRNSARSPYLPGDYSMGAGIRCAAAPED